MGEEKGNCVVGKRNAGRRAMRNRNEFILLMSHVPMGRPSVFPPILNPTVSL